MRLDPETMATERIDVAVHCWVATTRDAVWATEAASSTITRIDAATGEVTTTATIPDACGLGTTADDIWVTSPGAATISRLDPATAEVLMEVETPEGPFTVFPRGDVVFAAGEGGGGWLSRFDVATGDPLDEWMAPDVPFFDKVEFTEDAAWAVGRTDPNLYRLDPVTGEPQEQIMIGREPSGVVVAGDAIWVSQLSGRLTRIDPSTGAITNTWTTPYSFLNLYTFAFDSLWLTSLDDNAIIRVDIDQVDLSTGS
ncbi:MAG: PQQ-binding-like beta-propeller repeat protein [Chloroflexota bacterium]|nr:PQQ-binding-like beta-propeller repeat protein [Chloroflexota bacterium]